MSLTSQRAAYTDCYELFARAIATTGGVRMPLPSQREALTFQMRMNKARQIQRDESRRIYPRESPLYDVSEFDGYMVQIKHDTEGGVWIYVVPHGRHDLLSKIEPANDTYEAADANPPALD